MKYVVEDILVMKHGKNKKNSVNELPKKKRTYLLYLNEARFFVMIRGEEWESSPPK